jgi:hypothetical protein
MPLCTFPDKPANTKERQKSNNNLISQNGKATLAYGTNNSTGNIASHPNIAAGQKKSISHGVGNVSAGDSISKTGMDSFRTKINAERTRRGQSTSTFTAITAGTTTIAASHFNELKSAIQVSGNGSDQAYATSASAAITTYGAPGAQSNMATQSAGNPVYASQINKLVKDINDAGSACTCNCNYCSCNCNYCTCNCNYSCTCNCNYSDVTTKENIVYM